MPTPPPAPPALPDHRLRAGTAARLAGLPVTTLRVWERRYGVVGAAKAASGQRLYSPHDVSRLRLLRRLTQAGHAIGTIAALGLEALQALVDGAAVPPGPATAAARHAVAVGRSAVPVLEGLAGWVLDAAYDDLAHAAAASPTDRRGVGLLLVRLPTLQPAMVERVLALAAARRAGAVLVVYGFGTEASARALIDAGVTVRREPVTADELAQCVRALPIAAAEPPAAGALAPVERRRFSDDALARLARQPSPVACECLRHMTEIVAHLAGFERYSEECTTTHPVDAALHRHLTRTAGEARTLFERALEQVLKAGTPGAATPASG